MYKRMIRMFGRMWEDVLRYKTIGLVLIGYYLVSHFFFDAFCPSVVFTGFPCPGCGMTRSAIYVITGQFARAWNMNPLIYGWVLFGLYAFVMRYWFARPVKGWKTIIGILCIAMIAVFLYRMYLYFPNQPPMSYTGGNLFEKIVPGYGENVRKLIY